MTEGETTENTENTEEARNIEVRLSAKAEGIGRKISYLTLTFIL